MCFFFKVAFEDAFFGLRSIIETKTLQNVQEMFVTISKGSENTSHCKMENKQQNNDVGEKNIDNYVNATR